MSPIPATPHERLDAAMDERRQALGMTWAQVASDAKITVETLRAIRRGNNRPSTLTKRGLEQALQWQPGGIDAIYAKREPKPLPSDKSEITSASRPEIDLENYVPQSEVERAILHMYQATVQEQRHEREEFRRKLEEMDRKLDRLAGDDDDNGRQSA